MPNTLTKAENFDGRILGYTYLNPTNFATHCIQTLFTVEDSTHQISFKTPPSENVEITMTAFFNVTTTTDVTLFAGLSDSSSYNSIGQPTEYKNGGVFYSDDEADDHILSVKWVMQSDTLEAVGVSQTIYIGFRTSDFEDVDLIYGHRTSGAGSCYPPFIVSATALPATIYTG